MEQPVFKFQSLCRKLSKKILDNLDGLTDEQTAAVLTWAEIFDFLGEGQLIGGLGDSDGEPVQITAWLDTETGHIDWADGPLEKAWSREGEDVYPVVVED